MKTTISTSVSIVTQRQEREGDVTGLPLITITEKHVFDTEAQAERYREMVIMWLNEIPAPNGDMSPFPKRKVAPTAETLLATLDKLHGPDDLWLDYERPVGIIASVFGVLPGIPDSAIEPGDFV